MIASEKCKKFCYIFVTMLAHAYHSGQKFTQFSSNFPSSFFVQFVQTLTKTPRFLSISQIVISSVMRVAGLSNTRVPEKLTPLHESLKSICGVFRFHPF